MSTWRAKIDPQGLAAGNADAWATLMADYRPLMLHLGNRYGVDPDDLMQEAVIKLWRAMCDGRVELIPGVIAVNLGRAASQVAIDMWRYARSRPTGDLPPTASSPASTHRAALARLELAEARQQLAEMGERGAVVWLRAIGYGQHEAAQMLGIRPRQAYHHTRAWDTSQPGYQPSARSGEAMERYQAERRRKAEERAAAVVVRVERGEAIDAIAADMKITRRSVEGILDRAQQWGVYAAAD